MDRHRVKQTEWANDVFSKGCLISLSTHCWGGSSKLDNRFLRDDLPKDIIRAVYDLLEGNGKTQLKHIHEIREEAKRYIKSDSNSMPSPVSGLDFIPKDQIESVNEGLKTRQKAFYEKVDQFMAEYAMRRDEFAEKHPELYNPAKYPTERALRGRFTFDWAFRAFNVPDSELGILSHNVYREEVEKFRREMNSMRDKAISTVSQKFMEKITNLKKQCMGGVVSTATVNSLKEFMNNFKSMWDGFVGHAQLAKMINDCKLYLDGVGADELRSDESFKQLVGKGMDDIMKEFEKTSDARLHRSLDI